MTRAGSVVLIAITGIAWGLIAAASKVLFAAEPASFNGVTLAVARGTWALPLLLFIAAAAWMRERPSITARTWATIGVAAVCIGPFNTFVYSIAAAHTSLAHIAFLVGVAPMVNAAAAAIVFRAPLDVRARIALVLGVLGALVLASSHVAGQSSLGGDALMLVWLAGFAGYSCAVRAVGRHMSSLLLSSLIMALAMALATIPAFFGYGAAIAHVGDSAAIGWAFWGELIVVATLVAPLTFAAAIRRLGVSVATIGAEYTGIAIGVAASLAAHEAWTPQTGIGGALLIAALGVTFVPRTWVRGQLEPRTVPRA